MKEILICLYFLLVGVKGWSQEGPNLAPLSKYISKNFSLPKSLKLDCDYNYLAMVLESDSAGKITNIRYLNNADPYLKMSFDYLKMFRFDASMKVSSKPILLFVDIYQQDVKRCWGMDRFIVTPSKLTGELVAIMKEQIEKEPETMLWEVVMRFGARASW